MINQGDAIEIEIATPINQEQGTESALDWEELALLTTNPDLRKSWDSTLNITTTDTGKNGVLYVDVDGNNEPNNTLRVALHNREFLKYLDSETDALTLAEAVQNNYADLESTDSTMKAIYMGINGYFNLLPDSSPNYANPDSTLQRNEFMAMVYRAETPVQDLTPNTDFANAVGQSDYNIYAQGVVANSYLDLQSKSLNNLTANGTITRAEALYLLVSRYFSDDLKNVDTKGVTFSDVKDGGDIAGEQNFIEDAKEKDYWKSYELTYAIQNPDDGLPTDLYKALVVAKNKGLISNETRWDEALTKSEAIEFLVETLRQETGIQSFNAKQGLVDGYEITIEATTQAEEIDEEANLSEMYVELETPEDVEYQAYLDDQAAKGDKDQSDLEQSDIESLDKTMYAKGSVNTRLGPSTDYEKVGGLTTNQKVVVTGQSKSTGWYEIEVNGSKQYVSDQYLSDTEIQVAQQSTTAPSSNPTTGNANAGGGSSTSGGTVGQDGTVHTWVANPINGGSGDYSSGAGIKAE